MAGASKKEEKRKKKKKRVSTLFRKIQYTVRSTLRSLHCGEDESDTRLPNGTGRAQALALVLAWALSLALGPRDCLGWTVGTKASRSGKALVQKKI